MITALWIAATAVQGPVPPIIAVAPPAPAPAIVGNRIAQSESVPQTVALPAISIAVRVTANGDQLLNDRFRVSRNGGASYQVNRNEASNMVCTNQRYSAAQDRYSLGVNMYLRDDAPSGPSVTLNVRWQRPAKPQTCDSDGSREVQITQTIPLAPGQSVTVQGDAGLAVTLSR